MINIFRVNLSACFFALIIGLSGTLRAQTTGDYRSAVTGNWSSTATWQIFDGSTWVAATAYPGQLNNTTTLTSIRNGHTVTIDVDLSTSVFLQNVTIDLGGTLTDLSTLTYILYIENLLTVTGTIDMIATGASATINAKEILIESTGRLTNRRLLFNKANNSGIVSTAGLIYRDASGTPWVNQSNSVLNYSGGTMLVDISASALDNTVNYNSSSATQTIRTPIDFYYNLTLSGGGASTRIKILSGNTVVLSNLAIQGRASFRLTSFNISVAGDWNNSSIAAFNPGTGTVTLNGGLAQNVINTGHAGGTTFGSLTINNTSPASPQINVLANVTVGNTFTMTSGVINLNGRKFQLGTSNATATTLNHSVGWFYNGDFARYFVTNATIPNGTNAGFFPVGTSSNFRPFYLSSTTTLTGLPIATLTCPPSASTYSKETIPDVAGTISKVALSGWSLTLPDGAGGDFSVNAGGTGIGIIGDVNDLRLTQISSAAGTPGVNTGTPSSPLVQRTGLTATDLTSIIFYVGSVNLTSSPLPVELISFSGEAEGSVVNLHWHTRSELNCDYYTVYRSKNGIDFVPVATKKGRGTTKATTHYDLQDARPLKGTNYYRLSQTDFDGTTQSLSLISVEANGVEAVQVYPNPVKSGEEVHLSLHGIAPAGEREIQLFNSIGQEVSKQKVTLDSEGSFRGEIKLNMVSPGMYFIRLNETNVKILVY